MPFPLPQGKGGSQLTSKRDGCDLLIRPATANVAVVSWEPDLSKLRMVIVLMTPHGRPKGRTVFIQSEGVEGVVDSWVNMEILKSNLLIAATRIC